MKFFKWGILFIGCFSYGQSHFVQFNEQESVVAVKEYTTQLTISFTITPGYHIQDINDVADFVIPTEVIWDEPVISFIENSDFDIPTIDFIKLDTINHRVISSTFYIKIDLKRSFSGLVSGVLHYQACDDIRCFYPRELPFEVQIYP